MTKITKIQQPTVACKDAPVPYATLFDGISSFFTKPLGIMNKYIISKSKKKDILTLF